MDKKILTIVTLAAVLFASVAVGVSVFDEVDAESPIVVSGTPTPVNIYAADNSASVTLEMLGPAEIAGADTEVTFFTYTDGSENFTIGEAISVSGPLTNDGSIVITCTPGSVTHKNSFYSIPVTIDTTNVVKTTHANLAVKFTTTLAGCTPVVQYFAFDLVINKTVVTSTLTFDNLSTVPEEDTAIGSLALTQDVKSSYQLKNSVTDSNAKWYAEGLPKGMTMSETGIISGIPHESGEKTINITIYGTGGVVYKPAAIVVTVGTSTVSNVDIEVTKVASVDKGGDLTSTATVSMGSNKVERYIVSTGDTLTITLKQKGLTLDNTIDIYLVTSSAETKLTNSSWTSADGTMTLNGLSVSGEGELMLKAVLNGATGQNSQIYVMSIISIDKVEHANAGIGFELDVSDTIV